jgi:LPXTG-site transpeptidase (sortase) family protein
MKKSIATLGILLCTFALADVVHAFSEESFDEAVLALETSGVIQGYGEGNPRVLEYINRAEALKIIITSEPTLRTYIPRVSSSLSPIPLFPDINQQAWYAPYVEISFRANLAKGYSDGNFWPQGGVRVSEAALMITRALSLTASVPFQTSVDVRNEDGQWYTNAISTLLSRNAVLAGSRLTPSSYLTRGQFFDLVYRMTGEGRQVPQRVITQSPVRTISSSQSSTPLVVPLPGRGRVPVPPTGTESTTTRSSTPSVALNSIPQRGNASTPLVTQNAPNVTQVIQQNAAGKSFALSIPSIGITNLTVTHPTNVTTQKGVLDVLKNGVGHLFSFPGDGGKILVYGHSSSYPWDVSPYTKIFRGINKVNIGDLITVVYEGKTIQYQVSQKKTVLAKDRSEFEPDSNGEELILYTCWPPDSITHRFLVIARPVERVAGR